MRPLLLLTALIFFSFSLAGQRLTHRPGELLVRLADGSPSEKVLYDHEEVDAVKLISAPLAIYRVDFDGGRVSARDLKARLEGDPRVRTVQYNHLISLRAAPNDPQYGQQWQYNNTGQSGGIPGKDLNMMSAWDITTGGVTVNGDTIVVCVIDNGIDEDHEDLLPSLWTNRAEVPGNGVDDDNNGYVDDVHGWNTAADNSQINGGSHGTSVAGIVGARGNNGIGVTGVSWNVQLMIVRNNFASAESEVIQAYSYALENRQRYDQTGGAEGAYVVATNASWGVNGGDPADSPLWCAIYDTLGSYGILNVGATANIGYDVDVEGDLPTTCPSDFLIGVTNLTDEGELETVQGAAFGPVSIDLGAYGEAVYTTKFNNGYGTFGGTSAAAPQVAGAIGLLYAAPCDGFGQLLQADPAGAATLVRQSILGSTKPVASLQGISVTGGALDVGAAMSRLMSLCQGCLAPTSVAVTQIGLNQAVVNFIVIDAVQRVDLRVRVGSGAWTTFTDISSPYALPNLGSCTIYEVQLRAGCGGPLPGWEESVFFETDGCCRPPAEIEVVDATITTADLRWTEVTAAQQFLVRYRPVGTADYTALTTTATELNLNSLQSCTTYEFGVATDCDTTQTGYTSITFGTSGCGTCLDADYCEPTAFTNNEEWIAEVNIGNILINASANEPGGYRNFGAERPAAKLERGGTYPVSLLPLNPGSPGLVEAFKIWIDLDQNGAFTSGEELFSGSTSNNEALEGSITLPAGAPLGVPRLRVVMQFQSVASSCSFGNMVFGEAEDYCVQIVENLGCAAPEQITFLYSEEEGTPLIRWTAVGSATAYRVGYRLLGAPDWIYADVDRPEFKPLDLMGCEVYEVTVAAVCGSETGPEMLSTFNNCVGTTEPPLTDSDWRLYPNPTAGPLNLLWQAEGRSNLEVELYDLTGRKIRQFATTVTGRQEVPLSVGRLSAGVYLLRLRADGRVGVKRVVVR